ncbi:MAG TPA: carbohydrate ABC transporter permease [Candidatus Limnocylindrales bacterium]|nr:carbohydrate ABC transporter permease [Candidatus Limnocylindrales bacterium]
MRAGGKHVVLIAMSFLMLFPIMLTVSSALKERADVRSNPFGLFSSFSGESLSRAWNLGNFGEYMVNTFVLAVPSTVIVVALSTMAGYAFAKLPFRGRSVLYYLVVAGLLVPFFTYMIPLYFQLQGMGLLDTLPGVILVMATTGLAFGTVFMRAFFSDLPPELEQAARIDGASEWQIFLKVMAPLVRSGAGALAVFTFLQNWNNLLVPLLYLPGGNWRPLTLGLYLFAGGRTIDIGPLAAGTLITILPVIALFVVLQRQVTQGMLSGAVKG